MLLFDLKVEVQFRWNESIIAHDIFIDFWACLYHLSETLKNTMNFLSPISEYVCINFNIRLDFNVWNVFCTIIVSATSWPWSFGVILFTVIFGVFSEINTGFVAVGFTYRRCWLCSLWYPVTVTRLDWPDCSRH
jgi:hypothetical protein